MRQTRPGVGTVPLAWLAEDVRPSFMPGETTGSRAPPTTLSRGHLTGSAWAAAVFADLQVRVTAGAGPAASIPPGLRLCGRCCRLEARPCRGVAGSQALPSCGLDRSACCSESVSSSDIFQMGLFEGPKCDNGRKSRPTGQGGAAKAESASVLQIRSDSGTARGATLN